MGLSWPEQVPILDEEHTAADGARTLILGLAVVGRRAKAGVV